MRAKSLTSLVIVFILLAFGSADAAENVIHYFNGADGALPYNGVIFKGGNLYGVTYAGGLYDYGTVFELTPNGSAWTETVLYSFTGGADGAFPFVGLTFDNAGNLYGTTLYGGTYGGGVVFQLTPSQSGWTETVLQSFRTGPHSSTSNPSRVTFRGGNLYGTVSSFYITGAYGAGAVFELRPSKQGWSGKIIYQFSGGSDGARPSGGIAFDTAGNLYGTTEGGGTSATGVVFELTPSIGQWTETVLHSFQCCNGDGLVPSGLRMSKEGNIFGTTTQGGTGSCPGYNGCGTVWELTHSDAGWTENMLYNFTGGSDGDWPNSDLLINQAGIFGTTRGLTSGDTTVFQLTPSGNGWTNTVLMDCGVGGDLYGGVIGAPDGSLYGTRFESGNNYGYVFQLTK